MYKKNLNIWYDLGGFFNRGVMCYYMRPLSYSNTHTKDVKDVQLCITAA